MKLEEGEIIQSRYRLVSLKGRGSFGEVWLAKDEQTDMDVAVKVYIALDDKGLEEFKAEYKNSYSLNHPNLLHAYYFDVVDRQPFLVMPYCPDSAESLVGNTDEKTLLRFIRDVASGLEYLHARDIIHRDIKPDNILVNQEGNFVVTDFGVSSKMKSTLRRNSTRAMAGADVAGTIGYMAPELFSRNPDAVKATDIWALGATVFEMASGEMPFFGQGGALLLRGADIPELRGEWSEGFRNIVDACLARDTWDRPTAARLAGWANDLLNGRPVSLQKSVAPVVDNSSTVRIQTPPEEPQTSPVVVSDKKPALSVHTVVGNDASEKPKKSSFSKILLVVAIIAGLGGLIKVAMTPKLGKSNVIEKSAEDFKLPIGNNIYHGVAYLNGGKSVKIKKIELDFGTKEGKIYYSDKPLFLDIEASSETSKTKLIIKETNPDMKALSSLGEKVSSIYEGVINADESITGSGKNWKGEDFSFVFFPGEAKEKIEAEPVTQVGEKASPSKTKEQAKQTPAPSPRVKAEKSSSSTASPYLNKTSLELEVGESFDRVVFGWEGEVTWESHYPLVASVNGSGHVFGRNKGETKIVVTVGATKLFCDVSVKSSSKKVSDANVFEQKSISIPLGKSVQLTFDSAYGTVKWRSISPEVVSVSSSGVATALSIGEAKVWGEGYNGKIQYTVTVVPAYPSQSQSNGKRTVSGSVRDPSGAPIVGAVVMVKGTTNGSMTDAKGVYSIKAASGETLVFSCIGYQDITKTVGNESCMDVILPQGKSKRR